VQSTEHLPLVAPIYLGEKPALVMIKSGKPERGLVVLRLWQAHVQLSDSPLPVWTGTIEEVPGTYSWLMFRRPQPMLPLEKLLFTHPVPGLETETVLKQLGPHYRPRTRTILLVRPAHSG